MSKITPSAVAGAIGAATALAAMVYGGGESVTSGTDGPAVTLAVCTESITQSCGTCDPWDCNKNHNESIIKDLF